MTAMDVLPRVPPAAPVRRRWPRRVAWILLLGLAGAMFGLALATQIKTRYVSEGYLLVQPLAGNAFDGSGGRRLTDLETESHVVSSDPVLQRVVTSQGGQPTVEAIRAGLAIDVIPNAEVIRIRYAGTSQSQARSMVEAIAEATLAERVERAKAANAQRLEVIEALRKEAAEATPDDPNALSVRSQLMAQRQASLDAQWVEAKAPVGNPGRLITVVARGDGHCDQLRLVLVAVGALLGILAGWWVGRTPPRRDATRPVR